MRRFSSSRGVLHVEQDGVMFGGYNVLTRSNALCAAAMKLTMAGIASPTPLLRPGVSYCSSSLDGGMETCMVSSECENMSRVTHGSSPFVIICITRRDCAVAMQCDLISWKIPTSFNFTQEVS